MEKEISLVAIDRYLMRNESSIVYHVIENEDSWNDLLEKTSLRSPGARNGSSETLTVAEHITFYSRHAEISPYISATSDPLWALYYLMTDKLPKALEEKDKTAYIIEIDLKVLLLF